MPESPRIEHQRPFWKQVLSSIDAMLFPRRCVVCRSFMLQVRPYLNGAAADDRSRDDLSSYLCPECLDECRPIESPLCPRCGRMFAGRISGDHVCGECLEHRPPFHRTRAWGVYDGALLRVMHRFKYHHQVDLARPLGKLLYTTFRQNWDPEEIDVLIPVPLHPKKLRQRGFNQSHLLVRHWPRDFDGTEFPPLVTDWLSRTRWTRSQTGLKKQERRVNIRSAFAVRGHPPVTSKSVLLIDDVYTTGATAAECTRVLHAAGARRVDVLTLARAI